MATNTDVAPDTSDREIVITRVFDAPRELVFRAWVEPQHVARWWGPTGFTITTHSMDVRPGGVWRFIMHGPDGVDYPNQIVYVEIDPPSRLVYKHRGADGPSEHDFVTTTTFEDLGGTTRLTMRRVFPTAAARDFVVKTYGAIEGGKQTLARLAEYVQTMA